MITLIIFYFPRTLVVQKYFHDVFEKNFPNSSYFSFESSLCHFPFILKQRVEKIGRGAEEKIRRQFSVCLFFSLQISPSSERDPETCARIFQFCSTNSEPRFQRSEGNGDHREFQRNHFPREKKY